MLDCIVPCREIGYHGIRIFILPNCMSIDSIADRKNIQTRHKKMRECLSKQT